MSERCTYMFVAQNVHTMYIPCTYMSMILHLEPWVTVISHVISYICDITCDIGYITGYRQTVISHFNYDITL